MSLRTFLPFLLSFFLAGCAAPLADSPYRRVMKAQAGPPPHFVRAEAAPQSPPESVLSPSAPEPAMVREAACEALGPTSFVCADPKNPKERPAYVLRVAYYVRDLRPFRSPGMDVLGMVGSGGRVFGDHDPPQDAAHELVWRFTLARAGDGEVLFRSVQFQRHIQFWRFDVKYWIERHFSE